MYSYSIVSIPSSHRASFESLNIIILNTFYLAFFVSLEAFPLVFYMNLSK